MKESVLENLYSAPQADLSYVPLTDETYSPKFISIHGRLGRLRYLTYTLLSAILIIISTGIIMGIIAAVTMPLFEQPRFIQSTFVSIVFPLLVYSVMIAALLIYTKRRLNDLDYSGWFGVLMLVPFLNLLCALYLLFAPGFSGTNRYGAKPEENSGLSVGVGIFLSLIIIGILAAIAISAFQKYTE